MSAKAGHVLVVEDDEAAAELGRRALRRAGYEVTVVGSVQRAVEALSAGGFDVLLLDYTLPDGEPWRVVELARARTPRVPAILITAAGSEPVVAQALQRGVGDYIRKSATYLAELPAVVQRVCGLARAEEALRQSGQLFTLLAEHGKDMILTLDGAGVIRYASAACRPLLGYEMAELAGVPMASLIHPDDDAAAIVAGPPLIGLDAHCEIYRLRHRDGHFLWVESNLQHIGADAQATQLQTLAITRDITARITAQQRVEAALLEKTALLSEVHQRVKDNLQIIGRLLELQRTSATDAGVSEALLESESRIRALSLIHQFLYEQRNFARLDLTAYLHQLGKRVEEAHNGRERGIGLSVSGPAAPVWLGFEQAMPCGLLVNELLTNAYQHAFPGRQTGTISIDVFLDDDATVGLVVRDTGVGLQAPVDLHNPGSLGLQLAGTLVEQLKGRWRTDATVQGARFEVEFPAAERAARSLV